MKAVTSGGAAGRLVLWRAAMLALASPFLLSGVLKAADFSAATSEVRALTGLEPAAPAALTVILVQLGGSALLVTGGRSTKWGALILSLFTIAATLLAHAWWSREGAERALHFNIFWEHLAIVGGMAAAALGAGPIARPLPG